MKTNELGAKIMENRYIGKVQLTADDLGGSGCKAWAQYRILCDNIVLASYARLHGKGVDSDALGASVAALFSCFGTDAKATAAYQNRLMVATINRKANRSDTLRDAIKDKNAAKKAWDEAIATEKTEAEINSAKADFESKKQIVDDLYLKPNHYWFDLVPMLDNTKKHATDKARKAIEDIIADIIAERDMMTIEELQAEAQRLADERKGRELRKKAAEKAAKAVANAEAKKDAATANA